MTTQWPPYTRPCANHTAINAGFHEDTDGMHTALKVVWRDMGGVPHQEGKGLTALDEGLAVMVLELLIQDYTELVDRWFGVAVVWVIFPAVHL